MTEHREILINVALSYNQGTFMAAALELYNATGEDEYLRNAVAFGSTK